MKFFELIKSFFGKIKSGINLETGWIPFVNDQLKWAVLFFIRLSAIIFSIVFIILIVKKFDLISDLKSVVTKDIMGIIPKGTSIISTPDLNYDKDIKSIDDVIKMLEKKKRDKIKDDNKTSNN